MWTVKEIKEVLEELTNLMPEKIDIKVPVEISSRMTRSLGKVTYTIDHTGFVTPTKIIFSKLFLDSYSDEDIIEVIKHEFCHYYLAETTHEKNRHNSLFKHCCSLIGCTNDGIIFKNAKPIKNIPAVEREYKYKIVCATCGKTLGYRKVRCKIVQHPELYTSKCCNTDIKIIEL